MLINSCTYSHQTLSLARVELSLADFTHMTDQFRQEVLHRLDFVEDHLKTRVAKAEVNPADADALVGLSSMSGPAIQKAVEHAREVGGTGFQSLKLIQSNRNLTMPHYPLWNINTCVSKWIH